MYLAIEVVVLCLVFWLICFLGTGGDKKNMKSLYSYPDKVIALVKEREDLKPLIPKSSPWYISMISNVVMFTVILFIFAVWIRGDGFLYNFILVLILGESLNLFDFLIMDVCWWRNSKRIRFTGIDDKALYMPIKQHFYAFLRGAVAFLIVALIVGGIISAF